MEINPDVCYRAHQARDSRFDGRFFTGVTTTGIFCRPTCPAPTPAAEHVRFFVCAAAAQEAGFRPCLRCRPELAPDIASEPQAIVARALEAIAAGALDEGAVRALAASVGVTDRHLRRLFDRQLGTSPLVVAQTRRLLFAKQLLDETDLLITEVAHAAGFGSVRRFNEVFRRVYAHSPRDLRQAHLDASSTNSTLPDLTVRLAYAEPYDWPPIVRFLGARAIPGVEAVTDECYQRTIDIDEQQGLLAVRPIAGRNALAVTVRFPNVGVLARIVGRVRQLFDLGADPIVISRHLSADPLLAPVVANAPGLRVPGCWDGFELAVRAVLGQQVSVRAATSLAGRLVEAHGRPLTVEVPAWADASLRCTFPSPVTLAGADLTTIGLPRSRAAALVALARAVAADAGLVTRHRSLAGHIEALCQIQGIGEWTANYVAMRAGHEVDAFPASDLGLRRALGVLLGRTGPIESELALELATRWQPWRAYAAMHLWTGVKR